MSDTLRQRAQALQDVLGKPSNLCSQSCEKCAANDAEQLAAIHAALEQVVEDCAKVCDERAKALKNDHHPKSETCKEALGARGCAAAIRRLKEEG